MHLVKHKVPVFAGMLVGSILLRCNLLHDFM